MRSQKQSNKAPRPFKNQFAERGWSGGNRNDAFQLPGTSLVKTGKTGGAAGKGQATGQPPPEAPQATDTP